MINILDEKGKPFGLDYDYEYRGVQREKNRNAPQVRSTVVWLLFAAIFAFAGALFLVKHFNGSAQTGLATTLLLSLFCFALAGLFVYILQIGRKRHSRLMEFIQQNRALKI